MRMLEYGFSKKKFFLAKIENVGIWHYKTNKD